MCGGSCWSAPRASCSYLRVVDVVNLIEDDPLQVPDDVGAAVQHGAGGDGRLTPQWLLSLPTQPTAPEQPRLPEPDPPC